MKTFLSFALALLLLQPVHATTYTLHTVHSGSVPSRVRIVNLSDTYGVVEIVGFDDQGEEYGPVELEMEAHASIVLLTRELENGAPDKGLLDGLGDGSGQWQLELNTDLRLGAISFKSGVLSDVLSSAEAPTEDGLSQRLLWAHQVADRRPSTRISPGPLQDHNGYRHGTHELLLAYDWEPHQEVEGIELGWSEHELSYTYNLWSQYGAISDLQVLTRYGGRLDYTAFAVMHGKINGQPLVHAYFTGNRLGCFEHESAPIDTGYGLSLPPEGTRWSGAAVVVTAEGAFGYGSVEFILGETYSAGNDFDTLHATYVHVDTSTVHVDTGEELLVWHGNVIFRKHDPSEQLYTAGDFGLYGHSCSELAGWLESDGNRWAFGARRVETVD